MKKINIIPIIKDHVGTLKNAQNGKLSIVDFFTFYFIPLGVAIFSYINCESLDRESYSISITFFGIFIALLLNIQMAMFSIYQRKWQSADDSMSQSVDESSVENRRELLSQINSNISYLIAICCSALVVCLICYLTNFISVFISAIIVWFYTHFVLTMLMVVKRSHALFQREYAG